MTRRYNLEVQEAVLFFGVINRIVTPNEKPLVANGCLKVTLYLTKNREEKLPSRG